MSVTQQLFAALYARVSTARQEEQETIESQIEEIRNRIIEDGNILPEGHIFQDDGWTGEMLQRPGLDAMRDAAMTGIFQVLYVYDRGRLSRVFAYQEIIIEELVNLDIKFVTLHDIKAETAEERVLQAMQGVFHEYERVKIAERMRRGKLYKARNGVLINGHSLYGYDYIKKTDKEPAHYVVNEDQARVIRMIFDWVGNEQISLREVIRRLYDMGIPPRKGKSEFWTKGPLDRLLQCETYINGVIYYNKSEAIVAKNPIKHDKYKKIKRTSRRERPREDWIPFNVPVILDDKELFNKIQKILDRNQKYAPKNRKFNYLLSGLVQCECGYPRAGDGSNNGNGHHYYRCTQRIYKFPKDKVFDNKCRSQGVNAAILDMMVWKELSRLLKDPVLIREFAEEDIRTQSLNDNQLKDKVHLEESIKRIEEEVKRYALAYGSGSLDFDQFKEVMKDAKKRKTLYQSQLDELNTKLAQNSVYPVQFEDLCQEASEVIESMDYSDKVKIVRDLIDKVIIKERSGVEVWGHIKLNQTLTEKVGYGTESRDSRVT